MITRFEFLPFFHNVLRDINVCSYEAAGVNYYHCFLFVFYLLNVYFFLCFCFVLHYKLYCFVSLECYTLFDLDSSINFMPLFMCVPQQCIWRRSLSNSCSYKEWTGARTQKTYTSIKYSKNEHFLRNFVINVLTNNYKKYWIQGI